MSTDYNQWSTVKPYIKARQGLSSWIPEYDQDRLAAYEKYDQIYWNDPRAYALRVLEGEEPLYIPNARIVVDTTAYFLLKGLQITCSQKADQPTLDAFLKREAFYSRFNEAKLAGVARGDWAFHLTANPKKKAGTRLSLNSIYPGSVFPIYDDDEPETLIGCRIAEAYTVQDDPTPYLKVLRYDIVYVDDKKRVQRQEAIYKMDNNAFSAGATLYKTTLIKALLDERIDNIPIYWFKNKAWDGEEYGSSEIRGLESMGEIISQASTDVSASLSLEGLGVYATDGGRPVDNDGVETNWEVSPGRVMEVPSGSYFRRVEGVTSITPATDQISYLETKLHDASGLNGVALGQVEATTAASGIALAIQFMPTLAKIEVRDQHGKDILTQMFFDWGTWLAVFEQIALAGDIIPVIGDKLPTDRVAKVNELNNMLDRKVISTAYYRLEMQKLGYIFPTDSVIEAAIEADIARVTPQAPAQPAVDETPASDKAGDTLPDENQSNNKNAPNESKGTEAVNKNKSRDAKK